MKIFEFDKDKSYMIVVEQASTEDIRALQNALSKMGVSCITVKKEYLGDIDVVNPLQKPQ